jgi:hypothetical protein
MLLESRRVQHGIHRGPLSMVLLQNPHAAYEILDAEMQELAGYQRLDVVLELFKRHKKDLVTCMA